MQVVAEDSTALECRDWGLPKLSDAIVREHRQRAERLINQIEHKKISDEYCKHIIVGDGNHRGIVKKV